MIYYLGVSVICLIIFLVYRSKYNNNIDKPKTKQIEEENKMNLTISYVAITGMFIPILMFFYNEHRGNIKNFMKRK
jgi:hypothetical protein